jgi:hypothetical protein
LLCVVPVQKKINLLIFIPDSPTIKLDLGNLVLDDAHNQNKYRLFGFSNMIICVENYAVKCLSKYYSSVRTYYGTNLNQYIHQRQANLILDFVDTITHIVQLSENIYCFGGSKLYVWNIKKWKEKTRMEGFGQLYDMLALPNNRLATIYENAPLTIWNLSTGTHQNIAVKSKDSSKFYLKYIQKNKILYDNYYESSIVDTITGEIIELQDSLYKNTVAICDGKLIYPKSTNCLGTIANIVMFDLNTKTTCVFPEKKGFISDILVLPNSQLLIKDSCGISICNILNSHIICEKFFDTNIFRHKKGETLFFINEIVILSNNSIALVCSNSIEIISWSD